jgi:hypothetical protein
MTGALNRETKPAPRILRGTFSPEQNAELVEALSKDNHSIDQKYK